MRHFGPRVIGGRHTQCDSETDRGSRGPFDALRTGFAHAAVRPAETRARLIDALRTLETKRVERPRKKHDVMPV